MHCAYWLLTQTIYSNYDDLKHFYLSSKYSLYLFWPGVVASICFRSTQPCYHCRRCKVSSDYCDFRRSYCCCCQRVKIATNETYDSNLIGLIATFASPSSSSFHYSLRIESCIRYPLRSLKSFKAHQTLHLGCAEDSTPRWSSKCVLPEYTQASNYEPGSAPKYSP